ncbi:MAG: site-2 protease family protein [Planctomycetota bacterium]
MNLGLVKTLLWLGVTGILVGGLGLTSYDYWKGGKGRERMNRNMTKEIVLNAVDQPALDQKELPEMPYDPVKEVFHTMVWTGKLPEKKPDVKPTTVEAPKKKPDPVDKLLEVLFIQQDTARPERSLAMVKYTGLASGYQSRQGVDSHSLKQGDTLPDKWTYWRVEHIDAAGVTFAIVDPSKFDSGTDDVTVSPPEPIKGDIPVLGGDGSVVEVRQPFPEADEAARARVIEAWPTTTQQVRPGQIRLGSEDAVRIEDDYLAILSSEVRHETHINPRTGERDGIKIREIAPGSIAAQFGVYEGDVVKAINGHEVNSVNEAITFAKNNADYYSVWEVLVESAGKERTVTIETPPKK